MIRPFLLACPLALAACSTSPSQPSSAAAEAAGQDRLAAAIGDRVPGEPQNCVFERNLQGPDVVNNRTLIYRQGAGRLYVNHLPDECVNVDRDTILVFRNLTSSQLCRNDPFTLVDRTSRFPTGGLCTLGQFVPYERPSAD